MSGSAPKQKGNRGEREIVDIMNKQAKLMGVKEFQAKRIWGSGAGQEVPEIDVEVKHDNFPETWQVKRRHELPTWLWSCLRKKKVSGVFVREDNSLVWYAILPLIDLMEICLTKEDK